MVGKQISGFSPPAPKPENLRPNLIFMPPFQVYFYRDAVETLEYSPLGMQESYRRIVSHSSCVEKLLARQGKKPELTLRGEMEELRQELISPSLNDDMRVVDSSKKSLLPR